MNMENELQGAYSVRVEFEDVDSYKIAHHTKLLAYLERGRTHYFRKNNVDLGDLPFAVLVQKVEMRFIRPASLFDQLHVTARIKQCESYKFIVEQKIYRDARLLVKANVTHALQDFYSLETIPLEDSFIQTIRNS